MINSWKVAVIPDHAEIAQAQAELTAYGGYTAYLLVRAPDGSQANNVRQVVARHGYLAREPNAGEREALEEGLKVLGVATARRASRQEQVSPLT